MYVFINQFLQQATWVKGQTVCAFSLLDGPECPNKKKKLYVYWWKEAAFYFI